MSELLRSGRVRGRNRERAVQRGGSHAPRYKKSSQASYAARPALGAGESTTARGRFGRFPGSGHELGRAEDLGIRWVSRAGLRGTPASCPQAEEDAGGDPEEPAENGCGEDDPHE
jgi:hypothetical protein